MKSPVRRIHKIKTGTNIKEIFSDEALELMRDNCTESHDLAMIDMLASTGMRVGEMVLLNRNDIDFKERECVVFGKGNKERVVYFDARTKVHPHKFRRTLATRAIDKGMPIEQLQQLLGYRKIDTTLQYAMVKQSNVKIAHRKYI